ncbi:(d)CMP kinase [Pelagibacterales bacterium SAG-MED31]|nr:(d)CMP kinase [Pelagibacterales bacterium SAG-MED31]
MKKIIITIDGPAASGKGRIAKYVAKEYNFIHIDSGLLYRKIAKLLIDKKTDLKKSNQVKQILIKNNNFSLRDNNNLRNEHIGRASSIIAKMNFVRNHVNKQQILLTEQKTNKKGFVIDGRDIGSVVFKNADLKLFIDVNPNVRAKRRHKQLIDLGEKSIYAKILKEIKLRDKQDIIRLNSPLVVPKGAHIIDNSKSFNKTLIKINHLIGQIT